MGRTPAHSAWQETSTLQGSASCGLRKRLRRKPAAGFLQIFPSTDLKCPGTDSGIRIHLNGFPVHPSGTSVLNSRLTYDVESMMNHGKSLCSSVNPICCGCYVVSLWFLLFPSLTGLILILSCSQELWVFRLNAFFNKKRSFI